MKELVKLKLDFPALPRGYSCNFVWVPTVDRALSIEEASRQSVQQPLQMSQARLWKAGAAEPHSSGNKWVLMARPMGHTPVVGTIQVLGPLLDDYLHLVLPTVSSLFAKKDVPLHVSCFAMETAGQLSQSLNMADYASRIIHPLARILSGDAAHPGDQSQLKQQAMNTLCIIVHHLEVHYAIFVPMMSKVLSRAGIRHKVYESLVDKILSSQPVTHRHGF